MKAKRDETLEEIWAIRRQIAKRFGFDPRKRSLITSASKSNSTRRYTILRLQLKPPGCADLARPRPRENCRRPVRDLDFLPRRPQTQSKRCEMKVDRHALRAGFTSRRFSTSRKLTAGFWCRSRRLWISRNSWRGRRIKHQMPTTFSENNFSTSNINPCGLSFWPRVGWVDIYRFRAFNCFTDSFHQWLDLIAGFPFCIVTFMDFPEFALALMTVYKMAVIF